MSFKKIKTAVNVISHRKKMVICWKNTQCTVDVLVLACEIMCMLCLCMCVILWRAVGKYKAIDVHDSKKPITCSSGSSWVWQARVQLDHQKSELINLIRIESTRWTCESPSENQVWLDNNIDKWLFKKHHPCSFSNQLIIIDLITFHLKHSSLDLGHKVVWWKF